MTGPHPAVAATRNAVADAVEGMDPGIRLWVACSGGPDSLALAAATAFVAKKAGFRHGAIVVDHGLHPDSADIANRAVEQAHLAGMAAVRKKKVRVGTEGGLEAAARIARYEAIGQILDDEGDRQAYVLTGHTMDDQAETVLLALARGSGARALSGIPVRRGNIIRPFLSVRRSDTVAACEALRLTPWHDPMNEPGNGSRRAEVRGVVMPALAEVLGPGVVPGLARSASLLQADADELDRQARAQIARAEGSPDSSGQWSIDMLSQLPDAIRSRMLKLVAESRGAGPVTSAHVQSMDALVTQYRGQGAVSLPGGYEARREYGRLIVDVRPPTPEGEIT